MQATKLSPRPPACTFCDALPRTDYGRVWQQAAARLRFALAASAERMAWRQALRPMSATCSDVMSRMSQIRGPPELSFPSFLAVLSYFARCKPKRSALVRPRPVPNCWGYRRAKALIWPRATSFLRQAGRLAHPPPTPQRTGTLIAFVLFWPGPGAKPLCGRHLRVVVDASSGVCTMGRCMWQ